MEKQADQSILDAETYLGDQDLESLMLICAFGLSLPETPSIDELADLIQRG